MDDTVMDFRDQQEYRSRNGATKDRTGDNRMCHTSTDRDQLSLAKRVCSSTLGNCVNSLAHSWLAKVLMLAVCLTLMATSGCQTLSLPAIDPTGNRIFSNQWTSIISPHDPNNGYPSTAPAYVDPPEPPPCIQGKTGSERKLCKGCLSGKGCLTRKKEAEDIRGRCGQLLLTPTRIVAPVGGEVILLAGVCGKDEYLVTNEPIEWMLSPNGVGEIVEVGDDAKGKKQSCWKKDNGPKVEKLDVDFARGRTSREPGRITRGTSDPTDDLPIRKGQTWVSLTSASEGISNVTALAPDSDVWDKRRQTATIYWVDASWQPPTPQFAMSGEPITLVTRVMKAEGFAPATGWFVRYRVADANFAHFLRNNAPVPGDTLEAVVDNQGVAIVQMFNEPSISFGSTLVDVEVVRPAQGEKLPEISVFRGQTSVTWSAPDVRLIANGPQVGVPGQPLGYQASVINNGDMRAENVVLTVQIPGGMRFESSSAIIPPDPQPTPNILRWTIGPIEPKTIVDLPFSLVAATDSDTRVRFEVTSTGQRNQVLQEVQTLIQKPTVTITARPAQNRTQVEVGDQAVFELAVTNNGNQTINDLTIAIKSDQGLQHIPDGQNEVSQRIPFLNPGQRFDFAPVYAVQREGQLCIEASVLSLNQAIARQNACIAGIPARPKTPSVRLQFTPVNGNNTVAAGTLFQTSCFIENNGSVVLRRPRVVIQHDPNIIAKELTQGVIYRPDQNFGEWILRDLAPGEGVALEGRFTAQNPAQQSSIVVAVETADGVRERQTLTLQVTNVGAGAPSNEVFPNQPGAGQPGLGQPGLGQPGGVLNKPPLSNAAKQDSTLGISIRPVSNSIKKGDVATYEVRVENLRNQPDQRVSLAILIPEGSSIVSITPKEMRYKISNNDRQIDVEPIQYFRAKDVFSCVIELKHNQAITGELQAAVTSMAQTTPAGDRLSINVRP